MVKARKAVSYGQSKLHSIIIKMTKRLFYFRSTFCAEVSGSEMWELAPCYRLRKFICQKGRFLLKQN